MSFVKHTLFNGDNKKNNIPLLAVTQMPLILQTTLKSLSNKIIIHTGSLEHAVCTAKFIKENNIGEMIYIRSFLPTLSDWVDEDKSHVRYPHIPDLKQYTQDVLDSENLADIVTILGGNLRVTIEYLAKHEIPIDVIIYDIDHHLIDPHIFLKNMSYNITIIQQFKQQTLLKEIKRSRLFDLEAYMNISLIDNCLISTSHNNSMHFNLHELNKSKEAEVPTPPPTEILEQNVAPKKKKGNKKRGFKSLIRGKNTEGIAQKVRRTGEETQ